MRHYYSWYRSCKKTAIVLWQGQFSRKYTQQTYHSSCLRAMHGLPVIISVSFCFFIVHMSYVVFYSTSTSTRKSYKLFIWHISHILIELDLVPMMWSNPVYTKRHILCYVDSVITALNARGIILMRHLSHKIYLKCKLYNNSEDALSNLVT